jgi:tetratricopeptide (TPR) repeat protein
MSESDVLTPQGGFGGLGGPAAFGESQAGLPPSKPLQIFLLCAFVITALAYLADMHSQSVENDSISVTMGKFRRLIVNHSHYLDHSKYGREAFDKQHYDLAIYHFRAALVAADAAEGHCNLALAFLKQNDLESAEKEFKAALQLNPGMPQVYAAWGQALLAHGNTGEATRILRDGLQKSPDDASLHYNLGIAADAQNNHAEALSEYTDAARLGLDSADLWLRLGNLLIDQAKFADAETCLAKAVVLRPDSAEAQFKLASSQDQQLKVADAIKHYEAALKISPDLADALNNLALIRATAADPQARNPKLAISLATHASSAANDQNSHYLDTVARSYAANGDFELAVAWENKAIHRAQELNQTDLLKDLTARNTLFQQGKAE